MRTGVLSRSAALGAVVSLALLLWPLKIATSDPGTGDHVPGQVLVKFRSHASPSERAAIRRELGGHTLKKLGGIDVELISLEGSTVEEALERWGAHAGVEYIEPNYVVRALVLPDDPMFPDLWGLRNTGQTGGTPDADIDADEAWDVGTGSHEIVVGVLDTGVDYNHLDLTGNMWHNPGEIPDNGVDDDGNGFVDDYLGWDFYNGDNDPMDDNGHGTHVSGTIGAVGNNGVGVAGVCWSVRICPIKFLGWNGYGTTAGAIASVEYAIGAGVNILNNSWGGGEYSRALEEAIESARDVGMLFVVAAGNSTSDNDLYPHYPSSYQVDNVVAVAATDFRDALADFSSYGLTSVDLAAPGVGVLSTAPGQRYEWGSGTSMAAPHVSGAAALLWSLYPGMNADAVKERLLATTDPVPELSGKCVTGGRLNVFAAVAEPDTVAPGPITDLATFNPGSNTMGLGWSSSGDDGGTGVARYYRVRYSTSVITESTFSDASRAWGEPDPQPPGCREEMEVTGLDFDTTYFFAVKAYDEFGNPGPISNLAAGTTLGPPAIAIRPTSLSESLQAGDTGGGTLRLSNEAGGTLDFKVAEVKYLFGSSAPGDYLELGKEDVDPRTSGPVTDRRGGPDGFGYVWIDSEEPDGPEFDWVDITGVGTPVALSGDDDVAGPYLIGFPFPFYGNTFERFNICSNGFISFTSMARDFTNQPLPNWRAPENLIAPFWDDLIVSSGGVYIYNDGARTIIEYKDAMHYPYGGPFTFQVILYPSGRIVFQYLAMGKPRHEATVGIQNSTKDDGLQMAFNSSYVHGALAVEITRIPKWLSVSPTSGRVRAGRSTKITASIDADGLMAGRYAAEIEIESNDPDEPSLLVPVSLHVTGAPDIAVWGRKAFVTTTQRYSTPGASTNHLLHCSAPVGGPGLLTVEVSGDYGDSLEFATVIVEGVEMGTIGDLGWDCGVGSRSFPLGKARLEELLGDETLDVVVANTRYVSPSCGDSRHTVVLSYPGPADVLDFGRTYVGGADTLWLTVRNAGAEVLDVASISTDGPAFSVTAASLSIGPDELEEVGVVFIPPAPGSYSASLSVESNDPDEPHLAIPLSGEGVIRPSMAVTPDSLSETLLAGRTAGRSLTLRNDGGSDLEFDVHARRSATEAAAAFVTTRPLEEPAAEDLTSSLEAPAGYEASYRAAGLETPGGKPGADVLIVQDLMPWRSAATQVVLELSGLDYDIVDSFELAGRDITPYRVVILSGDQPTYFYDNVTALRSKLESYLEVGGVLEVHACGLGWNLGDFAHLVLPGGMSPVFHESSYNLLLEPGHPLVAYVPNPFYGSAASHGHFANVPDEAAVIAADDAGGPSLVTYGYGAGLLLASTNPLEYGFDRNQSAGQVLRNMVAYSKAVSGVSWLTVSPAGGVVAPGDSAALSVRFDAAGLGVGDYRADLIFAGAQVIPSWLVVPVRLEAITAPDIAVQPANLDFGLVQLGQTASLDMSVENEGSETLHVDGISADNEAFEVSESSFDLGPGEARGLTVNFTPNVEGEVSGVLTIYSDDPDEPELAVPLAGSGARPPSIGLSPDSVVAAVHPEVPRTKTLYICNGGGADLTFAIVVEGATPPEPHPDARADAEDMDAGHAGALGLGLRTPDVARRASRARDEAHSPAWLSLPVCEGTARPGECAAVSMSFDGAGLEQGEYDAALRISSNDPSDPIVSVAVHMILRTVGAAFLDLNPKTLNSGSDGNYCTCYIGLPAGYDPAQVDVSTVRPLHDLSVRPERHGTVDSDGDGTEELMVKFSRSDFGSALAEGDSVVVTVVGEIVDRAWFEGTDVISVIRSGSGADNGTAGGAPDRLCPDRAGAADDGGGAGADRISPLECGRNPATPPAAIEFYLPEGSQVSLKIFDASGALVRDLVGLPMPAGRHLTSWDGKNYRGEMVSAGVYFVLFNAGDCSATRKLVLVR